MWPIYETQMLIYESKAKLDEKILIGKTLIMKTVRRLYADRELRLPWWSMI